MTRDEKTMMKQTAFRFYYGAVLPVLPEVFPLFMFIGSSKDC